MLIKQKTSEQLYVMENNSNPLVQVYLSNEHAILCVVYKKAGSEVLRALPSSLSDLEDVFTNHIVQEASRL